MFKLPQIEARRKSSEQNNLSNDYRLNKVPKLALKQQ